MTRESDRDTKSDGSMPAWLIERDGRNPVTRSTIASQAALYRALLARATEDQVIEMDIARIVVAADDQLSEREAAIRESIPLLERSGRAVLATKLRKLVE